MTVQHQHGHGTTVVTDDREGPAAALMVVLAVLLVAFLVWFFAFSGVVFNRSATPGTSNPPTSVQNNTNTNTNPSAGTASTAPSPAAS